MLTLAHFLETLNPQYEASGAEPAISSVVMDSREVKASSLFVAQRGAHADGHDFAAHAVAQGAVALLAERPIPEASVTLDCRQALPTSFPATLSTATPVCIVVNDSVAALQASARAWRARFPVKVIGITGSVGKTSTKEVTHAVLQTRYRTFKSPGNRNSILGLPLTLFALRPFHEKAVLEMGMYERGEISTLCTLTSPEIGVVTLIGPVHLARAGSMDNIVAAKRELIEALPADGMAVLNRDDERVMSMAPYSHAPVFTYGLHPEADLRADNIHSMGLDGVRFTLHYQDEALSIHVPLLGRHSVHTALRAAAVGLIEGLTWDEIVRGLRDTAVQLRLVTVPGPLNSIIVDDTYNASPESVMAALNLLRDLGGRRVAVLGDMLELGHMEESGHRLIGRRVAEVAAQLIAVGRRARWIAAEAQVVGMPAENIVMVDDAETAVAILEERIQPDDVILVKGSLGMHLDHIINAMGRYD